MFLTIFDSSIPKTLPREGKDGHFCKNLSQSKKSKMWTSSSCDNRSLCQSTPPCDKNARSILGTKKTASITEPYTRSFLRKLAICLLLPSPSLSLTDNHRQPPSPPAHAPIVLIRCPLRRRHPPRSCTVIALTTARPRSCTKP